MPVKYPLFQCLIGEHVACEYDENGKVKRRPPDAGNPQGEVIDKKVSAIPLGLKVDENGELLLKDGNPVIDPSNAGGGLTDASSWRPSKPFPSHLDLEKMFPKKFRRVMENPEYIPVSQTIAKNIEALDKMSAKQLLEYAAAEEIEVGQATKREDLLKTIKAGIAKLVMGDTPRSHLLRRTDE